MKDYIKKYWFDYIFALVVTAVVAVLITIKFGYIYSTNDDVMLKNIISGNFTGTPESHVINIMYISGLIGQFLYNLFPQVSWYDLFMIGLHYLCWFLLVVRIGQQCKKKKTKTIVMLLFMLLLVAVDLKYMVLHQYTILTMQLVSVSVFWILTSRVCQGLEYWLERMVVLGTLICAMWLRKEAFLLALPILGLAVLYEFWKNLESKEKYLKNIIIYISIFLGILLFTYSLEKFAYGENEWSAFQESHAARIQVYDYTGVPIRDNYSVEYDKLDIDALDWQVIHDYNCELAENFDTEKMVGVSELSLRNFDEYIKTDGKINFLKKGFYTFCLLIFEKQIQPVGIIMLLAFLCVFILCYKENDKKACVVVVSSWLFYMAVYLVLIERGRYPERVMYGVYFMQMVCLFAFVSQYVESLFHKIKKDKFWICMMQIVCCLSIGLCFLYSWQKVEDEQNKILKNVADWQYVNDYFATNTENRYCIDTNSFVFSTEELFTGKVESDNMIRLGGWILNSPLQEQRMHNQGVDNLVQQLAEDDNYYIVQEEWKDTAWIDMVWQGKGYDVEAEVIDIIITPGGRIFEVVQIQ